MKPSRRKRISLIAILCFRCPACHEGKVTEGLFGMKPQCPHCRYDLVRESGFYLGAIAVSFLITAILTVPPMIALKVMNVDIEILIAFPFIEFLFVGSFLMIYSKVIWLHLEYVMTNRLDSGKNQ